MACGVTKTKEQKFGNAKYSPSASAPISWGACFIYKVLRLHANGVLIYLPNITQRCGGGIGRHAILRGWCLNGVRVRISFAAQKSTQQSCGAFLF